MTCGFCGLEMTLESRSAKSLYRCQCGAIRFVDGTVWSKKGYLDQFRGGTELMTSQGIRAEGQKEGKNE